MSALCPLLQAPAATPSPANATPESKPVNPSMAAFNATRGYGTAPDGGEGRGNGHSNGSVVWCGGDMRLLRKRI